MAKKMQGKFTAELTLSTFLHLGRINQFILHSTYVTFKAQVFLASKHHWCLDHISNQMTVSEIVEKYKVSKTMVYQWKDEFLSNASKVFESDRATRQQEKQIDNLHRKTGELEMELDFDGHRGRS